MSKGLHYGHSMRCMHLLSPLWLLCNIAPEKHHASIMAHLKLHALYGYSTALCLLPQRGCLVTACDSQVTSEIGRADRLPLQQYAREVPVAHSRSLLHRYRQHLHSHEASNPQTAQDATHTAPSLQRSTHASVPDETRQAADKESQAHTAHRWALRGQPEYQPCAVLLLLPFPAQAGAVQEHRGRH